MQVLVVDDHPLVIDAVKMVLRALNPMASVIEASRLSEACQIAATTRLELVLLDLTLPDSMGSNSVATLRAVAPDLPIAVFSGVSDPALMVAALDQGAMAFIPKTMPRPALIAALNDVLAGRGYLPANLVSSSLLRPATAGDRAEPERSSELTERQLEVLSLLVQGISNKSICRRLGISENTVKVHVSDPRGAGRWQGPAHPLTFYSTPPETKAALPAGVANRSNTARAASVAVAFVISAAS